MARAEKRQMSEPGPDRVGAVAERATGSAEMPDGQGRAGTANSGPRWLPSPRQGKTRSKCSRLLHRAVGWPGS